MHCFYVDKKAIKEGFGEIANLTGGKCKMLDVNSENGAKILTDFISKQVLADIDVQRGGDG